jgi:hypothetical protein
MQLNILEMETTMRIDFKKAIVAGPIGTALMTMVGEWVAPMMGIQRMNPAEMLAQPMGGSTCSARWGI